MLVACKKDKDGAPAPPDYMPMTAGSTWTYQPSVGASYTLTATNKDTLTEGRTFKVFSNSNGRNRYRLKSANEYYQLTVIPQISKKGFAELYLKDNQPVGAKWKSTIPVSIPNIPLPLMADLNYAVKAIDTVRTVNNQLYKKVIRVRLDVSFASFGSLGSGDLYFADKVGLIESSVQIGVQGQQFTNLSEKLTSYSNK